MVVDGVWASDDDIVEGVRVVRRLRSHGVTRFIECDDRGDFSGRLWGMLAEPSAHAENEALARLAGCAYEQIVNEKADGRFYDPVTGYTLTTVQIKHSSKGVFLTSADGGTEGGKLAYNIRDAEFFQFRESCVPCRSVFVSFKAFPLDEDGYLQQKSCRVDHCRAKVMVKKREKDVTTPEKLVELLKTRAFYARASIDAWNMLPSS